MRYSQLLIPTLREAPADAEVASHSLMMRAGYIRKIAAGVYAYLPLCLKVLRKIEQIVRQEMEASGAQELLLPVVIPAELWIETGRWAVYGKELLRFKDRHDRDFCIGPTHEEAITDLIRNEISLVARPAEELLPDQHQVPRRGPPALRADARPRIHHEGRLLL